MLKYINSKDYFDIVYSKCNWYGVLIVGFLNAYLIFWHLNGIKISNQEVKLRSSNKKMGISVFILQTSTSPRIFLNTIPKKICTCVHMHVR